MFRRCVFALAILLAAGLIHQLQACSCLESGPPCQAWATTDAVFLGRVVDISLFEVADDTLPGTFTFKVLRVRFAVESAFRGVAVGTVEVTTSASSSGCGYPFELNRRYVVYAGRHPDGALGTGLCSRTRRVENAEDDLAFFRSLPTSPAGARVFGQLGFQEGVPLLSKPRTGPMTGTTVIVEGAGGLWNAVSDTQGRYQVAGLPPGNYEVKPQSATGSITQFNPLSTKVTLVEHGCAQVNAYALVNGRISGFVSYADGRPAPSLPISLLPESMSPLDRRIFSLPTAFTAEDGSYKLSSLPSGRYLIVANLSNGPMPLWPDGNAYPRTYFPATTKPSEAQVIELAAGAEQLGVDIKLPRPLQKREVHGIVVWSDGKRAKGARLNLRNSEYGPAAFIFSEANADGTFSISAYEGQPYTIVAASSNDPDGKPLKHTVSSLPTPVRDELTVVTLPYPATLRGRLVDARGQPLPHVMLELIPEEAQDLQEINQSGYLITISDSGGRFEMTGLSPRRYLLGVHAALPPYPSQNTEYPPTFYPGAANRNRATVIEMKAGQKAELRDFVLPEKLNLVTVEGIVVWPDDRAVQHGLVIAHDAEFTESSEITGEFGADGRFALQLFMGRRYEVHAMTWKDHDGRETLWSFESTHAEMLFDSPEQRLTLRMSEKP